MMVKFPFERVANSVCVGFPRLMSQNLPGSPTLKETCGFPVFRDLWAVQGAGESLWSTAPPTGGAKHLLVLSSRAVLLLPGLQEGTAT